ncbi:hypothetical protein ACIBCT_03665 [Streptosporangium sp. NPDC050855]|uniref:hypothetical protein n=1 Tax=Streptosporangium sp. NPDC050855 TaxID=3366194 RepID=UPI0037ABE36E
MPHDPERPGSRELHERRRVHRTDWMALLSGMLFVSAGVVFVSRPSVEPLIMLTILVGGLGLAGLVAILARVIRR